MRNATLTRKTKETDISLSLELDGRGEGEIDTGCGFLDHMLTLFAFHARFDLRVGCVGDVRVDDHHTVEDVGIVLGKAVAAALGERRGITRYGSFLLPMDEVLALCAVDLGGRDFVSCDLPLERAKVGTFDTELVSEFFWGFARAAGATIHVKCLTPGNTHHVLEAAFKGFGRAMKQAVAPEEGREGELPSSKGLIS